MTTDRPTADLAGPRTLTAAVGADDSGERLDRMLARHFRELSRTRLKSLVAQGCVTMDGATITDPSMRVKPGQRFQLAVPEPVIDRPEPQAMALDIRYEDADLLVIDKPAGLVVHPAPGNPDATLVNALLAHCGAHLSGIGGVRRPGIVHRLDKDTSGLMVVAKSEPGHAGLSRDFAAKRVERAYRALIWGVPTERSGEVVGAIGRSPVNRKRMAVVARGGKPAITRYRVLRAYGEVAALLECRLATGRTHQIRVHLAQIGHPVIGDPVYGRSRGRRRALPSTLRATLEAFPRQALHAVRLGFRHPTSGQHLQFESEFPSDIKDLASFLESL